MAATPDRRLSTMPTSDLADLIRRAVDELSDRGTHEAFRALLEVLPHAGERLGHAARNLAAGPILERGRRHCPGPPNKPRGPAGEGRPDDLDIERVARNWSPSGLSGAVTGLVAGYG
jgi:hypothetical protein